MPQLANNDIVKGKLGQTFMGFFNSIYEGKYFELLLFHEVLGNIAIGTLYMG